MRLALITDIHFGVRSDSPLFMDNQFKFYEEVFFPYIKENDIRTVFILGDTWDRRKYINFNTLHLVKINFFNKLRDLNVEVKIIYGNHDVFYRNTNDVNSIDMLELEYPNIEVIKTHKELNYDGCDIGMISWIHSGNIDESLKFINECKATILCGHFEIKSFEMIKGNYCDHGFDKSMFDRFEYVFSGHFHVISSDGKINYIGNPHQTNWSDYGLKKGFHIFETSDRTLTFVENPYNIYEKVMFDDALDIVKFNYDYYKNKIVRVVVKSFTVKRKQLDLFIDKLSTFAFSIDIHEAEQGLVTEEGIIEFDNSDTFEMIEQYIGSIELNGLDKSKLKTHFREVYIEAQDRMQAA